MPKRPGHFTVILAALLAFGFGDAYAQMGFGGFGGFGSGGFGGGGFGGFGGGRGFGRQGGGSGFGGGGMGNNRGNGSGMPRGNGGGFGRMGQGQNGGGYGRMGQGQAGGGRGGMGQTGRATGGNQTGRYGAGNGRPAGTANNSGRSGPYGQQNTRTTGNYGQQNRPQNRPYPNKTRPPYGPVVGQGPGFQPSRQTYYPPRVPRIPVMPVPVYAPPVVAGPPSPTPPPRPIVSGGGGGGPPARTAAPARPPVNSVPAADNQYVSNEVLIRTNPQTPIDEINRIERQYGLTPLGTTRVSLLDSDLRRYRVANGASVPAALQALGGEAGVAAQPNYLFELQDSVKFDYSKPAGQTPRAGPDTTTPAPQPDPQTLATTSPSAPGPQSNPANNVTVEPEHPPQYAIDAMRLADAHKMATGADVLIAIIDTGLDESHPEIEGTVADRFDAVDGTFTPHSHGTGMAGVIVAHKSLVGIAPGARLLAIRAFASMAKGARGTSYDILRGLDFAADHNARIINMSFAGPRDALLAEALAAARAKGMIAVAAAGNAGPASQPLYPAAEPGVIAITATDTQNRLYARANRGDYVTAAAPGVDVIAPSPGGAVQLSSGTSIAAAEASGVIALLLQTNPQMSADQVRKILAETAVRSPAEAGNSVIDASAALQSMTQAHAHQSQ